MNQIRVKYKGPLRGEIITPQDKSISHRAIMFSSLAKGKSIVRNFLRAEDPLRTLGAFRQMGVEIEEKTQGTEQRAETNELIIHGNGLHGLLEPRDTVYCGNSGTTMRLLSGVLAGQSFPTTLAGDASLSGRPMNRVITPLTKMGAVIESQEGGRPPLTIRGGGLSPITYESPVASAQVKSAVLLAGLYCNGVTTVIEPGKSRDHTERMLQSCGAEIIVEGLKVSIQGTDRLNPLDISVPGDISSAAFFIVAGLIVPGSELLIRNIGINPSRTGIIEILRTMGADITLKDTRDVSGEPVADIAVNHSVLKGINIDGGMLLTAIDEFPILCVAAAKAEGTTTITGAEELRVKESDRIAAMAAELKKMGVPIEEFEDGLTIEGREHLTPAAATSYGDHRIAMSMIIAGLTEKAESTVNDTDCVSTSFPGFMELLESLMS